MDSASTVSGATRRLKKPQRQPFVGRQGAAGEQQLRRAPLADDSRQDRAGAHVAAGQADSREQKRGLGARRAEAQVGSHGEDRAGAGANAIHRRDDGLRAGAHGLHQVAGHAREVQQARGVHAGQRADDLVYVAAGAEIAAGAGDDDGADVVRVAKRAEQVAQLGVGVEGQRVLALRPVQRDGADAALAAATESARRGSRPARAVARQRMRFAVQVLMRRLLCRSSGAAS